MCLHFSCQCLHLALTQILHWKNHCPKPSMASDFNCSTIVVKKVFKILNRLLKPIGSRQAMWGWSPWWQPAYVNWTWDCHICSTHAYHGIVSGVTSSEPGSVDTFVFKSKVFLNGWSQWQEMISHQWYQLWMHPDAFLELNISSRGS